MSVGRVLFAVAAVLFTWTAPSAVAQTRFDLGRLAPAVGTVVGAARYQASQARQMSDQGCAIAQTARMYEQYATSGQAPYVVVDATYMYPGVWRGLPLARGTIGVFRPIVNSGYAVFEGRNDSPQWDDRGSGGGRFAADQPTGLGQLTFVDRFDPKVGEKYCGQVQGGVANGLGQWWAGQNAGHRYIGQFAFGSRKGLGAFYRADGTRGEGEFRSGRLHGVGAVWTSTGEVLAAGRYDNGTLVESMLR